jgi:predicted O-methyltransferase YrrM
MPEQPPQPLWVSVENYIDALLIPPDEALDQARRDSAAAGLPDIAVTPSQGRMLWLLARLQKAQRILELGTLGGYSTIWMARALPDDGCLVSIEADPKHCEIARANITRAGFAPQVDLRLGRALDILPELAAEGLEAFDFFFIDADKENAADYFRWAVRLGRPGALIVIDNVVRDGEVANPDAPDPRVQGIRRLNEAMAAERRVTATTIQTVGSKGYDGFTLALLAG